MSETREDGDETMSNRERIETLLRQGDTCSEQARQAIGAGSPVAAREWMEAAEKAYSMARALRTRASSGSDA